jgi:hypothetical protein
MMIILTSTANTVELDGVRCRVWEGVTINGTPVYAYIPRVQPVHEEDAAEFERELEPQNPPSVAVRL